MRLSDHLLDVYRRLYAAYGPQHWWPAETPFEVVVGAILTQSAAWTNVEKAIVNLKAAGALSPEGLARLNEGDLARLIYPAGYFNAKARKLKALVALLFQRFDGELERLLAAPGDELRPLLLATHGIGPETADSILLYAAGRSVFVIDAYTRRLFSRLGMAPRHDTYDAWQALFMQNLEPDAALFNEYHALIVRHGKGVCRREPRCDVCHLLEGCPTGRGRVGAGATGERGPAGGSGSSLTGGGEDGGYAAATGQGGGPSSYDGCKSRTQRRRQCNTGAAGASYSMVPNPPFWARHRKATGSFPVMLFGGPETALLCPTIRFL